MSAYRSVELISNSSGKRANLPARFIAEGSYFELPGETGGSQRLYLQAEACRNSSDAYCQRSYAITGDLDVFQTRLKCYAEVRNDSTTGYAGQALQGLCQDPHSRSYSFTISR
ncbi:hypothetical protein [Pseudoduganella aquatica]|uniref:Uncharacterized protein n=1 Tax=Pseudoduganella aquatica TaxID=2660641 RepID=A0A7X4HHI3_9BURK|nr:hypothetical protein [Pseudoduganella aquatica]MYN11341.1 hypothetical protein [Pseudoduganella aquatica]